MEEITLYHQIIILEYNPYCFQVLLLTKNKHSLTFLQTPMVLIHWLYSEEWKWWDRVWSSELTVFLWAPATWVLVYLLLWSLFPSHCCSLWGNVRPKRSLGSISGDMRSTTVPKWMARAEEHLGEALKSKWTTGHSCKNTLFLLFFPLLGVISSG